MSSAKFEGKSREESRNQNVKKVRLEFEDSSNVHMLYGYLWIHVFGITIINIYFNKLKVNNNGHIN